MHKQNGIHKRPILSMAMANLESWVHSPRTILMMLFTIMLCYLEVNSTLAMYSREGFVLNWAETPYILFQNGINILMSSMLIFVMISEIPRMLPYQNYMLIRANRKRWLTSQIVYCLFMLLAITIIITICILLFSLGKTEFGSGWSDTARIAQDENMAFMTVVPKHVREHYAPLTGVFYAAAPVFLFWFSMAMIILLCSLLGSQMIGLVICAFILLANFVGSYPLPYPINYATVSAMNPDEYGPELYRTAAAVYAGLDMTLILAMYWRISKTDLVFYSENKL
jgi:hypothetical protein